MGSIYNNLYIDVCNPHPNFDHMTTPEEFYQNVVTATNYLDTQLPMGSNVIFMGLADGLILFNAMHDRIHPLGELRQDVTYENLYDTAILVSSDTDLIPALMKARLMKKKVEYIGFSHKPSYGLIGHSDIRRLLTKEDIEQFFQK